MYIQYSWAFCLSHSTSYIWDSSISLNVPSIVSFLYDIALYEYTKYLQIFYIFVKYVSILMMNIWGVLDLLFYWLKATLLLDICSKEQQQQHNSSNHDFLLTLYTKISQNGSPDLWYFSDSSSQVLRQHKQEVQIIPGKIYHFNDLTPR